MSLFKYPIPKITWLFWKYFGSSSSIAKNYRVGYRVPVWHWRWLPTVEEQNNSTKNIQIHIIFIFQGFWRVLPQSHWPHSEWFFSSSMGWGYFCFYSSIAHCCRYYTFLSCGKMINTEIQMPIQRSSSWAIKNNSSVDSETRSSQHNTTLRVNEQIRAMPNDLPRR